MKLNKIAVSCALALATLSSQAFALTAFDAPDADLFLPSDSVPPPVLKKTADALFDAAQGIFVFYDDGGTPTNFTDDGKNYRAYFGVVKAGPGVDAALVGKKVRLQHRIKVSPKSCINLLVNQIGIANMNVSSASCVVNTANPTVYGYACAAQGEDTSFSKVLPNKVPDFC